MEGEQVVQCWQPKRPGAHLLTLLLPILAAMVLLTGWIARRVSRHALHNSVLSDRRFAMLMLSQQELADSEARFRDLAEAALTGSERPMRRGA
ncbi:bifunctional diguanylate cyclase/phosphodiesterase|nr:bifunctional diguanylate cyclase/phosphodiesterase [Candidatus Pantoea persica]